MKKGEEQSAGKAHGNTRRLGRDFVPSTREELDGYARRAAERDRERKRVNLLILKQQGKML